MGLNKIFAGSEEVLDAVEGFTEDVCEGRGVFFVATTGSSSSSSSRSRSADGQESQREQSKVFHMLLLLMTYFLAFLSKLACF
jgi:hypothetical protein